MPFGLPVGSHRHGATPGGRSVKRDLDAHWRPSICLYSSDQWRNGRPAHAAAPAVYTGAPLAISRATDSVAASRFRPSNAANLYASVYVGTASVSSMKRSMVPPWLMTS